MAAPLSFAPIKPIQPVSPMERPSLGGVAGVERGEAKQEFQDILRSAIDRVDSFRQQAEQSSEAFLRGENEEVHKVVFDAQRSELAFEAFVQVRNKVVNAYQEIMRMQL